MVPRGLMNGDIVIGAFFNKNKTLSEGEKLKL